MATIETGGSSTRTAHRLMNYMPAVLAYLGIVATFATATLIGCVIWLLIW